ncbi:probable F420-dependent oxidoreductase, MSMEG_2516 family [Amycolatopsis xylanica]|uniref:Probable F420-dependent oxidoreductase, MSMEG_2516 family n=1 Tax=Amycolatopsis xylanica TaxID=589385 RepID=A0A1H3AH86_9PSEU|nr:LLM class F420-dependent oxidoreductase [Amycolatopsis xylanica]SDX28698.1 probable F420-dependent oxidoreductase, MSMEG_2516 family [Amycolatopsis xylanica]
MTGDFRFGVNMVVPASRTAWAEKCRKAEDLGFDVIGAADHLWMAPPFPALVLAAEATERVRLNTYVLNAAFYNPVLLAREVTGTDLFIDGRLELGLGAGYIKEEFESTGMPWPSASKRVDHLEHTVKELKRLYADPDHQPAPVQKPGPPLLIAGRGDRLLTLAAEHADIIGFPGAAKVPDGAQIRAEHAEGILERIEFVRGKLNGRQVEFNVLTPRVVVTNDRAGAIEEAAKQMDGLTTEQVGQIPTLLCGTHEQMAEQIRANRERFGFTYVTVLEGSLESFAPVIELLK